MSAAFFGTSGQGTVRITGGAPGPSNVATRIFSFGKARFLFVFLSLPIGRVDASVGERSDGAKSKKELLPPCLEGLLEGAFAGGALFQREDRAAAVVVNDRHIEPGALLEELQIA